MNVEDLVCGETYLLRTATAQILTFTCTGSTIEGSTHTGTLTRSRGSVTTIIEYAMLFADARPDVVATLGPVLLSAEDRRIVSIEPVEPPARTEPSTEARLLVKVREIMREHLGDIGAGVDMLTDLDAALTRRPVSALRPAINTMFQADAALRSQGSVELTPAQRLRRLRTTLDKNAKLVEALPPWTRANMSDGTAARFAQQPAQEKLSTANRVDDWTAFADLRTQLARVLGCDPRASLRGIVDELSSRPTPASEDVDGSASDPPMFADVDVDAELIDELYGEGTAAKAVACMTEHVDVEAKPSKAYCCEPGCEEPASVRIFDTRAEYDCAETHACNGHATGLGVSEEWSTWENIPLDDHVFVWNVTSFEGPQSTSIEFDPDGPWLELDQTLEEAEDTCPGFVCVHPTPVFASLVRAYGREGVARWAHTVDIKDAPELTPADAEDAPKITAGELRFWKRCEDAKREVEAWPQWKRDAAANGSA